MINHPARLMPVPLDKIDTYLPAGDVIIVRRVYPAEMQPDTVHKWSRDFLVDRIKVAGAFFSAPLRGSDTDATTIGIPSADGGFLFIVNPPKPTDAPAPAAVTTQPEAADGG